MSDVSHPWDRMPDEPNRWYQRFEAFRLQGPGRTIEAVYRAECEAKLSKVKRPSKRWYEIVRLWSWYARAAAWDKHLSDQAAADAEKRRIEILNSGFALQHERVAALGEIADTLLTDIKDPAHLWPLDEKGIGQGDNFQVVEVVRFNGGLVDQFRGTLDDIAKEMGDRKEKPGDTVVNVSFDLDEWKRKRSERLASVESREEPEICAPHE
jgi:hypothetical protein